MILDSTNSNNSKAEYGGLFYEGYYNIFTDTFTFRNSEGVFRVTKEYKNLTNIKCQKKERRNDMEDQGMIKYEDYKQVFEESCMSVIEGLIKHAKKADIQDTPIFMKKWIDFYWNKEN